MGNLDTKLKDCPFCGGKAEIRIVLGRDTICCKDCNATMISDYTPIETLIEMWNKRTVKKITAVWASVDSDADSVRCSNCNNISNEETDYCQRCGATMIKLHIESCPFCKTTPFLYKDKMTATQWGYAVKCINCTCLTKPKTEYYKTLGEVVNTWNNCLKGDNDKDN